MKNLIEKILRKLGIRKGITFTASPETLAYIRKWQDEIGAEDEAAVIKLALSLISVAIEHGGVVYIPREKLTEDQKRQLSEHPDLGVVDVRLFRPDNIIYFQ